MFINETLAQGVYLATKKFLRHRGLRRMFHSSMCYRFRIRMNQIQNLVAVENPLWSFWGVHRPKGFVWMCYWTRLFDRPENMILWTCLAAYVTTVLMWQNALSKCRV